MDKAGDSLIRILGSLVKHSTLNDDEEGWLGLASENLGFKKRRMSILELRRLALCIVKEVSLFHRTTTEYGTGLSTHNGGTRPRWVPAKD